jgi:hypothetical protein
MHTIVPPLLLLFLMRKHERPAGAAGD